MIILLLLDRLGKALRTPSRDTIVSVFSKNIGGLGKAFRIHSAVDQIGAIIGPLLLAAVLLFTSNNYQAAFPCFDNSVCFNDESDFLYV